MALRIRVILNFLEATADVLLLTEIIAFVAKVGERCPAPHSCSPPHHTAALTFFFLPFLCFSLFFLFKFVSGIFWLNLQVEVFCEFSFFLRYANSHLAFATCVYGLRRRHTLIPLYDSSLWT